jgi:hypothetical protein
MYAERGKERYGVVAVNHRERARRGPTLVVVFVGVAHGLGIPMAHYRLWQVGVFPSQERASKSTDYACPQEERTLERPEFTHPGRWVRRV